MDVYAGALGIPGVVNGDEARSQGLELEVNTIVGENLTVDLGLGYTDAEVTTVQVYSISRILLPREKVIHFQVSQMCKHHWPLTTCNR